MRPQLEGTSATQTRRISRSCVGRNFRRNLLPMTRIMLEEDDDSDSKEYEAAKLGPSVSPYRDAISPRPRKKLSSRCKISVMHLMTVMATPRLTASFSFRVTRRRQITRQEHGMQFWANQVWRISKQGEDRNGKASSECIASGCVGRERGTSAEPTLREIG